MDRELQCDFIQANGVFIGKVRSILGVALYFQVEGFYVEIIYSRYRCDVVLIECFTDMERISDFIPAINIEDIDSLLLGASK